MRAFGWNALLHLCIIRMLFFDLSHTFSRIRLRGSTRLDFLHRMSTGDLLTLQPGQGKTTVLTTPIGRIIDYLIVLAFDDSLLLLGGGGNQDKVIRWLRKYIFFNDDVQVSDETDTTHMFGIGANGDSRLIEKLNLDTSLLSLLNDSHRTVASSPVSADGQVTIVRTPEALKLGFFLIGEKLNLQSVPLVHDATPNPDFDAWRILQGYPRFPNEINEDYIPLETGLWGAVSFNKGCYTGQEILARMESRGQIAKKLTWLTSSADALKPGEELYSESGELVGKVTSATPGASLGYVRSAFAQKGQSLRTNSNDVVYVARIVRI